MVDFIGQIMKTKRMSAVVLHSGLTIQERNERMMYFRHGNWTLAITTNLLARGIDIPSVRVIINFDIPCHQAQNKLDNKTYIYRMGRSMRFGQPKGLVINLATSEDHLLYELRQKHDMTNVEI